MSRGEHLRSQRSGSPGRWRDAASCPLMDIAINTHLSVGVIITPPPDTDYKIFVGRGPQTGFYKEAIKLLGNTRQETFQGFNLHTVKFYEHHNTIYYMKIRTSF